MTSKYAIKSNARYDGKNAEKMLKIYVHDSEQGLQCLLVLFALQTNVSLIPDQAERLQHKFTAPTLLLKVKPETQVIGGSS